MRQVLLQLEVQLVDNKPLNKASVTKLEVQLVDNKPLNTASVTKTRGSTRGQQTP
jgi:hypothetical protein